MWDNILYRKIDWQFPRESRTMYHVRNKKRAVSSEIGEMMLDGNCKMVSKQVRKISPIRQSKSVMVRVTPEVWNAKVGNYDQQLINAILRHAKRSLEANKKYEEFMRERLKKSGRINDERNNRRHSYSQRADRSQPIETYKLAKVTFRDHQSSQPYKYGLRTSRSPLLQKKPSKRYQVLSICERKKPKVRRPPPASLPQQRSKQIHQQIPLLPFFSAWDTVDLADE